MTNHNRTLTMTLRALVIVIALQSALATLGQVPARSLGGHVDKFTGDFQYSLPLLVVPGPNGESFPVTLQYHGGGIGVDQPASEAAHPAAWVERMFPSLFD